MSQEEEKRAILERKRNILMLVSQYLTDYGLVNTNEILGKECGLLASASNEYTLCDNVDLESIFLDYMSYHQLKFGRPPKIAKRQDAAPAVGQDSGVVSKKTSSSTATNAARRKHQFQQRSGAAILKADMDGAKEKMLANSQQQGLGDALQVSQLSGQPPNDTDPQLEPIILTVPLLRNHPNYSPEWAAMAEMICRDVVDGSTLTNVSWDALKGHHGAKEKLTESVLTPLQYPHLFAGPGAIRPWKCVLLHGPPGTGKTCLARALCKETAGKATFFNVSSSSMVSKWRGDSEKLVRILFDVAKYYAPSIVFIDEVEGLMSKRDCSSEHEASKRFKNELLTHIDGLDEMHNVFVLGSTNMPWDLDPAFLRRFERKLLLGLPDAIARGEIIRELMPHSIDWPGAALNELVELTVDFTGDDIRIAHKEAAMRLLRETIKSSRELQTKPATVLPDITANDFRDAIAHIRPESKSLLAKYEQWDQQHGCT